MFISHNLHKPLLTPEMNTKHIFSIIQEEKPCSNLFNSIHNDLNEAFERNPFREKISAIFHATEGHCGIQNKDFLWGLIDKLNSEKKENAKSYLIKIVYASTHAVNSIDISHQEKEIEVLIHFSQKLVDLLKSETQSFAEREELQTLTFENVSLNCLLTVYEPRELRDKIFIWIKRLFAPIAYALHQLCGIFIEKRISDSIYAAMPAGLAYTLSLFLTFATGYVVVGALHKISSCGVESAKVRNKTQIENKINSIIVSNKEEDVTSITSKNCSTRNILIEFTKLACFFSFDFMNDTAGFNIALATDNSNLSEEWKTTFNFAGSFLIGIPITIIGCLVYLRLCDMLKKYEPKIELEPEPDFSPV